MRTRGKAGQDWGEGSVEHIPPPLFVCAPHLSKRIEQAMAFPNSVQELVRDHKVDHSHESFGEVHFLMMLFIMLCKVVLTFDF